MSELYTQDQVDNAVLIMEHVATKAAKDGWQPWLGKYGGSAEFRAYVCAVAQEMDAQVVAIGVQWGEDAEWWDLCETVAEALIAGPGSIQTPKGLVAAVFAKALVIEFVGPDE